MTRKLLDDCFLHDRDRLTHAEALALLEARVRPVAAAETIAVETAVGRILATSARAVRPVPAHTNSAVDGYAFAHAGYDAAKGSRLAIAGRAAAGHTLATAVATGSAARIFTGAVVPSGTDSVVMQEDVGLAVEAGVPLVEVPPGLKAGANVRRAGEDVKEGEELYRAGHIVRPQDLAALASIGYAEIACFARLRVAIVSSGDEIVRPGQPLAPGQVYDANAPMLRGLVESTGAAATDLGVWPDEAAVVRARLAEAAGRFDVVLTSGGASRGEEDHMVGALDAIGKRHLWQLAIKPGRPMSFGQVGDCVVLGLPGNPVAVFVCFLMYAWPLLRRLGGADWTSRAGSCCRRRSISRGARPAGASSGAACWWKARAASPSTSSPATAPASSPRSGSPTA